MNASHIQPLTMHKAVKAATIGAGMALAAAVVFPLVYPTTTAYICGALLVLVAAYLFALVRVPSAQLDGTTLHYRGIFGRKQVDLRTASRVALVSSGTGVAVLQAKDSRGAHGHGVLALTEYMKQATPPHELRALAEALGDRPETASVLPVLRAQADHLESGGALEGSPLATYAGRGASRTGQAGAAGAALDL